MLSGKDTQLASNNVQFLIWVVGTLVVFILLLLISHSFLYVHFNVIKTDTFRPENSLARYLANMY